MASNYAQYSFAIENVSEKEAEWLQTLMDDDSVDDSLGEYSYITRVDDYPDLFAFYGDYGECEYLIPHLQKFLQLFRPKDHIYYSVAWTCSTPRIDEFGGAAVLITADEVKQHNTAWIIDEWIEELKEKTNE